MKALLLLFLVFVVWSDAEWMPKKPYPKKVNPEINRNLHLRRYIKNTDKTNRLKTEQSMKKQLEQNRLYTVFPQPGSPSELSISVRDSPLFPLGETLRVKKEVINPWRKKRSIDKDDEVSVVSVLRTKRAVAKNKKGGKSRKAALKSKKKRVVKRKAQKPKPRQSKVEGRRLIAARDAIIEEYPYTVSIQKGNEHWCSGALLNQRMVITTANCVWKPTCFDLVERTRSDLHIINHSYGAISVRDRNMSASSRLITGLRLSRLRVRAGSRNADRGGQTAKIQEMRRHPKWDIRSYPDNDVALLLLDRRIKFSNAVHGVDLPNRIMLPPFDDVWVTSYGANRRDGLYPDKDMSLQVYHAILMDRDKCNNVTQRFGVTVTENFICLAQTGRRAPCTRDTGAPAVSDGVVWALASWGIRKLCGTPRYPAVYSYLGSPSNMDFIRNATKELMSDKVHYPFLDRFPPTTVDYRATTTTTYYYTGQH